MLEPWETLLWMAFLGLLLYFVLSACFLTRGSMCRTTLVAARNNLAAQGALGAAVQRKSEAISATTAPRLVMLIQPTPVSSPPPAQCFAAGAKLLAYTR